jgi:ERCC4-related helicase
VAQWKEGSTAAAAAADADADPEVEAEDGGAVVLGGMKQEEQERVLQEFRAGTVQVLLATCIGEEGLDVPQVRGTADSPSGLLLEHACNML